MKIDQRRLETAATKVFLNRLEAHTGFEQMRGVGMTQRVAEYDNQLLICGDCRLSAANPFGIARSSATDIKTQKTVCFSEVPLHCLDRLAKRRSRYGIGFTKQFAKSKGAQPVWYVEKDSEQHNAIDQMMAAALATPTTAADPIWKLTPFIDVPGTYPSGTYRFEWEREWRCVGDFRFDETDVAFLIIPEELHVNACEFFRKARDEHIGPFYGCPYIDSSWGLDEVSRALASGWPHEHV